MRQLPPYVHGVTLPTPTYFTRLATTLQSVPSTCVVAGPGRHGSGGFSDEDAKTQSTMRAPKPDRETTAADAVLGRGNANVDRGAEIRKDGDDARPAKGRIGNHRIDSQCQALAKRTCRRYAASLWRLGIYDDALQAAAEAIIRHPKRADYAARRAIRDMIADETPKEIEIDTTDPGTERFISVLSHPRFDDLVHALQALGKISPQQREVILLHFWEGMTFEEIGDQIGVSHSVAYDRYTAGIKAIREALGYAEH